MYKGGVSWKLLFWVWQEGEGGPGPGEMLAQGAGPLGPEQGLHGEAVSSPSLEGLTPRAGVGSQPRRAVSCSGSMEHARKMGAGLWKGAA